ncbi:MAG: hypothetical protein GY710_06980 [Desulfobacteraceae bacterium]|nr:hypothetical protein [Desulfobacteraceae bacterium]
MNLIFTDINNAFSNLTQADSQAVGLGTFNNSKKSQSLFADNLNHVIKEARTARASFSSGSIAPGKASFDKSIVAVKNAFGKLQNVDEAKTFFLDEVDQEQGLEFLSKLQALFLSLSGGDLKNITIDATGLDFLKEILLKNGFGREGVEELMAKFSDETQDGDLGLDEIMGSLFDLSTDISDETPVEEALIDTSALPFLTSILNSLGLPREKVDQILSQASRGQNGISLDVVIDHLRPIEIQSLHSGQPFQTREGDTSFPMLLEQLGLVLPENTASQPSLSDLIASLVTHKEKILASGKSTQDLSSKGSTNQADGGGNKSSNTLIDSLFKHLEIQSAKTDGAQFSKDQIEDQFENDLLIPDKFKPNKKGLFSKDQGEPLVKQDQAFKEINSILSGKSDLPGDTGSKLKDGEEGTKFLKPDTARGGESSSLAASEVKTGSPGDVLKTKSTFKELPTYVTKQVGKSIVRAINQGENTLKIQLKPAELGRLQLTINNEGNSMKVSIAAENPAAKDILIANVNELKIVLANAGISLDKFDVEMNSEFKQSYADAKNQSGNSNGKNRNGKKIFDSINAEGINGPGGNLADEIQDGSYHFVA